MSRQSSRSRKAKRRRSLRLQSLENRQLLAATIDPPASGPGTVTADITDLPAAFLAERPDVSNAIADDGLSDAATIQAVVDWLSVQLEDPSIDVATVFLPTGTFHVDQSIVVDAGVSIVGEGMGQSVITHTADYEFTASDITDREVQVNTVNQAGYLFNLGRDADGVVVRDLALEGPAALGGLFAFDSDDLQITGTRFESFVWSGLRTFNIDGFDVYDNHFVNAGGRKINEDGGFGANGGGIFATFTRDAEVSNNRFERTADSEVNYFGIKGRKWSDSRIHHNTIGTNFSIELPFENDARVEIDHNDLSGVISIPKFAGGPDFPEGESFNIHHNYFTTSYAIEGARNGLVVDSNVFEFDINEDGGNLFTNFGSTAVTGSYTFTNNLVVNPGRGLISNSGVQDDITIANNLVIGNQTINPRSEGMFGFRTSDNQGNESDFSTYQIVDNVFEFNGISRPLFRSSLAYESNIENNTLVNVGDAGQYVNPDTGAPRGPLTSLQFNVGVDGERFVDGDAIADRARNAVQPSAGDADGDAVLDVVDPAPADSQNGLGTVLRPGDRFGTDFELADGTSPLDPATGFSGINVNQDAFRSVYDFDPYGVLTSPDAQIQDGQLVVATNNSDGFGSRNQNADAYGFLFNAAETERFTVSSKVIMQEGGLPQASFAAVGVQIGVGTQESYIKFTRSYGGGRNRFEVLWEEGDSKQDAQPGSGTSQIMFMTAEQEAAPVYELFMSIDRVQPGGILLTPSAVALDAEGVQVGETITGTTFRVTGEIADAINGNNQSLPTFDGSTSSGGLFVGVYSTDYSDPFNRVRSFTARWEDLWVRSDDPTAPAIQLSAASDTGVADGDGVTFLNNASESSRLVFEVSGVAEGDFIEIVSGENVIGSAVATGETVGVFTDGITALPDGSQQVVARRTVDGFLGQPISSPFDLIIDTQSPSTSIASLPGGTALEMIDFVFDEPVFGLDVEAITLSRDGVPVDLADASLTSLMGDVFQVSELGGVTNQPGNYAFDFDQDSGVTDLAGNAVIPADEVITLISPLRSFSRGVGETVVIPHESSMLIDEGEVSFRFTANNVGRGTLVSKDHLNFGNGGHLTIRLRNGEVEVRLQSTDEAYFVRGGSVQPGMESSVQFSFGADGMRLSVDGVEVASNDYTGGLAATSGGLGNTEDVLLGGSKVKSTPGQNDRVTDRFDGRITDFELRTVDGGVAFSQAVTPYDLSRAANEFNGVDQFVEFAHEAPLELSTGSIGITFNTSDASKTQTLFSKDSTGFDDGGHLTARLVNGRLEVRLQSDSRSYFLRSQSIQSGVDYSMQVFFGEGGFRLLLNGVEVDQDDYEGGIGSNLESLVIGASQRRGLESSDRYDDYFQGSLGLFFVEDADGERVGSGW
ncbi:MAG: LamG domain-containing protein [Planctomycetota bacterium]